MRAGYWQAMSVATEAWSSHRLTVFPSKTDIAFFKRDAAGALDLPVQGGCHFQQVETEEACGGACQESAEAVAVNISTPPVATNKRDFDDFFVGANVEHLQCVEGASKAQHVYMPASVGILQDHIRAWFLGQRHNKTMWLMSAENDIDPTANARRRGCDVESMLSELHTMECQTH